MITSLFQSLEKLMAEQKTTKDDEQLLDRIKELENEINDKNKVGTYVIVTLSNFRSLICKI